MKNMDETENPIKSITSPSAPLHECQGVSAECSYKQCKYFFEAKKIIKWDDGEQRDGLK